jgi:ribosomal protein S18 acetylase RimI-like enzyme
MKMPVTIYYLAIDSLEQFVAKRSDQPGIAIVKAEENSPSFHHYFFNAVGQHWRWFSRLPWTYEKWSEHLAAPGVHTWYGTLNGTPFGYYEVMQREREVEIVFFGLLPEFFGRGLGGHLLTEAVESSFALGADRVWLHTCTLDSPRAVANYEARGFQLYKEREVVDDMPDPDDPIWLTADFRRSYLDAFAE